MLYVGFYFELLFVVAGFYQLQKNSIQLAKNIRKFNNNRVYDYYKAK